MSGHLFDTSVLLDLATRDRAWFEWSNTQFTKASLSGPILINPIIFAELAPAFDSVTELDSWLDPEFFERLPLPYDAGWVAAQAFIEYRRRGGTRNRVLPDFYIGAHAQVAGVPLVTRDTGHFGTYFPDVPLITP